MCMFEEGSGVLGCSGADGLIFQKREIFGGLSSVKLLLARPWNYGGSASSGPKWDLEDGLCFRAARMEDGT